MKILITGGAGFIGSNLAYFLNTLSPTNEITIFDTFNDCTTLTNGNPKYLGSYENLIGFRGKVICGNLCNESDLELLGDDFDVIYHLAAISDTRASNQNVILSNNVNPLYHFIKMVKRTGAKLVYASSAATYGSCSKDKFNLGDEDPNNIYAYSKWVMDNWVLNLLERENANVIGLRYFNVYGYGEKNKGLTASTVLQFYQQIKQGKELTLFENSERIFRDFIYIDDVINATYLAGLSDKVGVFNIGTGVPRTFADIANIVKSFLKAETKFNYIENPYKSGYQFYTCADMTRTKEMLKFYPKFSLEEGISDYLTKLEKINKK